MLLCKSLIGMNSKPLDLFFNSPEGKIKTVVYPNALQ